MNPTCCECNVPLEWDRGNCDEGYGRMPPMWFCPRCGIEYPDIPGPLTADEDRLAACHLAMDGAHDLLVCQMVRDPRDTDLEWAVKLRARMQTAADVLAAELRNQQVPGWTAATRPGRQG